MPAVTCFVAEMEVKDAFNGKIGRGIACHHARPTSSTIVAGPSASFSVPSFVILFYIFNSAISSISSERLPAQLVAILPERHSHFTERKRKIPHQLRDIHTYGVLAQSSSRIQWLTCMPVVCLVQLSIASSCPSPSYMHVHIRSGDCS